MLYGDSCGSRSPRYHIQSSSPQAYWLSKTIDALLGAASQNRAIGSAFCRHTPSAPQTSNLYSVPVPTPGRKVAHTPLLPIGVIGVCAEFQPLKVPANRTLRALGAQTAKR